MVFALACGDRQIVDARDATLHEASFVELPVLVAVRAIPVARIVMPLIGETNSDAIALTGPELFDQTIVQLLGPFASQELLDRCSARQELRSVAPDAVGSVGQCYSPWIARIPGVFSRPHFLSRSLGRERRQWRTGLFDAGHVACSRQFLRRNAVTHSFDFFMCAVYSRIVRKPLPSASRYAKVRASDLSLAASDLLRR